jgi:nucleoside-diphosphate-sugar epimerase
VKIAVTGASGFIGRHVVAHLSGRGDEVVAVRRPFVAETLSQLFHDVSAVVHLAGLVAAVRERDFVAANVDATRVVAHAARDRDVRLVHISSLAAAGPAPPSAPRSEDDPSRPISAYGRSKLAGERVLHDARGLRWIALRPGIVYGPGDRALLPLFRVATRGLMPLVGRAGAAYTLIHVADVVRAIAAAIDSDVRGEAIFTGHATPATPRAIAEGIRAAVAPSARIIRVPMPVTRVAALAGDIAQTLSGRPALINESRYRELAAEGFVCRVDRLRDRLGVVAEIALNEGLEQTAEWYRREGWLGPRSG